MKRAYREDAFWCWFVFNHPRPPEQIDEYNGGAGALALPDSSDVQDFIPRRGCRRRREFDPCAETWYDVRMESCKIQKMSAGAPAAPETREEENL